MIGFQNPEVLMVLAIIAFFVPKIFGFKGLKKGVAVLNIFIAVLIVAAAAGPELVLEDEEQSPQIKYIQDGSESSQLLETPDLNSDSVDIETVNVNSDSESFESQVRESVNENDTVLFSTDFNAETDSLKDYFEEENVSSNALRSEIQEEHAVNLEGPSDTAIGVENSFTAETSSTKGNVTIEVGQGNDTIYDGEAPHKFELVFDEEGRQKLWVKTEASDEYESNNEYYKVVDVRERPEVAAIGVENLGERLEEFYDVEYYSDAPGNLEEFDNVITDESLRSGEIENYLTSGGGLVYTGDEYDAGYLPVRQSSEDMESDAPLIVFAIDVSQGTESSGAAEAAKQVSYELVDELPGNTRVGVVAYNRYAYNIAQPVTLSSGREDLKDSISSLQPEGNTFHNRGLEAADTMMGDQTGNIVMVSDGELSSLGKRNDVESKTLNQASATDSSVVAVGVGEDISSVEGEEKEFLTKVSENGNGYYVDGHSAEGLDFDFEAGGGLGDQTPLRVSDSEHFINENGVDASVSDLDSTSLKPSASQVVSAGEYPFLTTWRYGTGKVSAFSGDTSELDELIGQDPGFTGRVFSWTTRQDEKDFFVEGERVGDDFKLVSREPRENFTRRSTERHEMSLNPNSTGFHSGNGVDYSVNYRPEIAEVGYNEEKMEDLTVNGRVYSEEEVDGFLDSLEPQASSSTYRVDLTPWVLSSALILYILFIGLRKRNGLV